MQEYVSVDEARTMVLENARTVPSEEVPLTAALGRTLAAEVRSSDDIPPFDNSAMDGYAVRVADLASVPAELRIIEDVPAGTEPRRVVSAGTCTRIMTGAPFPQGADAVAPVEWTTPVDDQWVRFERAPAAGANVRPAGKDVRKGEIVLEAGEVVTPPVVGMLASVGVSIVRVRTPPRVAVIATGDELVDVGERPKPGQIRNSNGPALVAQARAAGGEPLPPLHARDDRSHVRRTIEQALEADVLVFSGGVSVGKYDYVKAVLEEIGVVIHFWKVRQRPGKPLVFGTYGDKLIFGLPGNPVSSAMCFDQYVRPALARMMRRREVLRPKWPALLVSPIPKKGGLHYFSRGVVSFDEGRLQAESAGNQGSHIYSSVVRANSIIHLSASMESAPEGSEVEVELLSWG